MRENMTMMRRPMMCALGVVAWVSVASTTVEARGEPTQPQTVAPSSQATRDPGDEPGAPPPASRPSIDPRSGKQPAGSTPSASRGSGQAAGRRSPDLEIRFDALRIGADLHGPAVLEVRSLAQANLTPLHRLHRSFVLRILENVEAPALHR